MPKCRVESSKIGLLTEIKDCRSVTSPEIIGQAMTAMRLRHSLTAVSIAEKIQVNTSTISRYENGHFTFEQADLDMLESYAEACGEDRYSLFNDYLLFRKFSKQILSDYISKNNITKSDSAKVFDVSKTLALNWFNKENRCPSMKLWEDKLKAFTVEWIERNM